MNILYAVHHFPPNYTGGAEWRTHRTASIMQRKGYSVYVVCIENITFGKLKRVEVKEELFGELPVFRLNMELDIRPDQIGYLYENPVLGETISELIETTRTDLFHLFGGYLLNVAALQSSRSKGVPSIVSLTDFWYLCPNIQMIRSNGEVSTFPIEEWECARCMGEKRRRYRWLGRIFPRVMAFYWKHQSQTVIDIKRRTSLLIRELNLARLIISPSNFLRESYIRYGVNPQKIVFSRQGVDLSTFPECIPDKISRGILRVGYIGQIVDIKGVHILIEAINKLKAFPIQLSIYGDLTKYPNYVKGLRNMAGNNPNIQLKGEFDRKDLLQVMDGIDVLVVPSLWYENSPNIILEAFATCTPVIASDLGGMAELVRHQENGLLFEPGDSTKLAEQIQLLLESPALREKFSKPIESVKNLQIEMDELEKIYKQVVGLGII
jgi:glycosyltransferase involved in cell wall biosynthesis